MPNIKPVSDLHNYGEVLRSVAVLAQQKLLTELEKGRRSGEEQGYSDAEDVFAELGARYND